MDSICDAPPTTTVEATTLGEGEKCPRDPFGSGTRTATSLTDELRDEREPAAAELPIAPPHSSSSDSVVLPETLAPTLADDPLEKLIAELEELQFL